MRSITLRGGLQPRIAGRPCGVVRPVPVPTRLTIQLQCRGVTYQPLVSAGQAVTLGDALAEATLHGATVRLPAPATGNVSDITQPDNGPAQVTISPVIPESNPQAKTTADPDHTTAADIRQRLLDTGIWPFIWSSSTGCAPLPSGEQPKAIVINFVHAEPFRARGKTVLQHAWKRVVAGMRYLPRLLADYGTIEIVLTNVTDPLAQMLHNELAGDAWIHFYNAPITYPIEHPVILDRRIRQARALPPDETIWVADVQTVAALGTVLAEGRIVTDRVVGFGGPGCQEPGHASIRIGTPIRDLCATRHTADDIIVLRGGLFTGQPVDLNTATVGYDDDAFFCLPTATTREFLSFIQPGFDRRSAFPCFAANLTGEEDRALTNLLRGETRPCVACGKCESLCPMGLMPQVLHRYLHRQAYDEAVATGLNVCIDCGICTYVCPSKIELGTQFINAKRAIKEEKRAAEGEKGGGG